MNHSRLPTNCFSGSNYYLKCPESNGGCGEYGSFSIAIKYRRIILDCSNCEHRLSLPFVNELFFCPEYNSMPIEYSDRTARH